MSKEELFKKYQEILLKTNGGADDYVVAQCQISNLIKEFAEEKDQQITDLQSQLAITEKALELACRELDNVEVFDAMFCECDSFYEYYLNRAKEMMKSE